VITSSFWLDRRVFVTGHTGFKGAWLGLMLERLSARVTGYGLDPATDPSLFERVRVGDGLCDVRGDVCDAAMLDGVLRSADPDIVIHLATHSPRSDGAPVRQDKVHEQGDRAMVEAIERAPFVQSALIVSSDALSVAPDFGALAANGAEAFAIHCPEPIGGGDFATRLADVSDSCALHVLDALYGVLLLAQAACRPHRPMNRNWTFGRSQRFDARYAPQNIALGWSPLLDPTEAVAWTREWRRAFEAGADMRAVTLEQVDCYLGQRVRLTSPFAEAGVGAVDVAA
jgi:CDP-glucose 4,6-dehydratase